MQSSYLMAQFYKGYSEVEAAGNKPKIIREYVGRVNTGTERLSIAHMQSPAGWVEPGQTPEFEEYTIMLEGQMTVKTKAETFILKAGNSILVEAGEWVQYSTPDGPASYVAVCLPAFSMDAVHRDE